MIGARRSPEGANRRRRLAALSPERGGDGAAEHGFERSKALEEAWDTTRLSVVIKSWSGRRWVRCHGEVAARARGHGFL